VCQKKGCISYNHSKKERAEARSKIPPQLQYLVDSDDDSEHSLSDHNSDIDDGSDTFITEAFSTVDGRETTEKLANQSLVHTISQSTTFIASISNTAEATPTVLATEYSPPIGRYSDKQFHRIVIDTGAGAVSYRGYSQYIALQRLQHVTINPELAQGRSFKFGIGSTTSRGVVEVDTPIKSLSFHIVNADTPFLLALKDLDRLRVYYNNLSNRLVRGNESWPIVRKFGHPFFI